MFKKIFALGLSVLSLGGFFSTSCFAKSYDNDAELAAAIQQSIMDDIKSKNLKEKIRKKRNQINENERAIKKLQKKRESLDSSLAIQLQLQADCYSYYESIRIQSKIDSISNDIRINEAKIKSLESKRERLDGELAVLLQQEEFYRA